MSSKTTIRYAELTDLEYVLAFDADPLQPVPPQEMREQKLKQAISGNEVFLAVDGVIPIAYARITFLWPEQQPFWVWGFVQADYRQKGILNQLHDHICGSLKDQGFQRLLFSASSARPEMVAMMRRQGHTEAGHLRGADGSEEIFFWEEL